MHFCIHEINEVLKKTNTSLTKMINYISSQSSQLQWSESWCTKTQEMIENVYHWNHSIDSKLLMST